MRVEADILSVDAHLQMCTCVSDRAARLIVQYRRFPLPGTLFVSIDCKFTLADIHDTGDLGLGK